MEKNYDGYYVLQNNSGAYDYCHIHYLQVQQGKIVDCVYEVDEHEGYFRETYLREKEALKNAPDYEKIKFEKAEDRYLEKNQRTRCMQAALGEDIRDFLLDKMLNDYGWKSYKTDSLGYIENKDRILGYLGISEEEHNHRVADILQSKENKATLGKTGVMNKLTEMKNGRSGK